MDLGTDAVPKKFVGDPSYYVESLPPVVNLLDEDQIFKEKYDEDDGDEDDGLINPIVDSKHRNNEFYYVYRNLRK